MSVSMPSRRNLVAAGAWAAPAVVLASAAPSHAASGECAVAGYTIDWGQHYDANTRQAVAELGALGTGYNGSTSLTMQVSNQFFGDMQTHSVNDGGTYTNMAVSPGQVGGLGQRGLVLMQRVTTNRANNWPGDSSQRRNHRQQVTLSFSRAVTNLRFTITDIDAYSDQYRDRVEISGSPSSSQPAGSVVTGSGTQASPWLNSSNGNNDNVPIATGSRGNLLVNYGNAAVQAVTVTFWNDEPRRTVWGVPVGLNNRGQQGIYISQLSFNASTCAA